MSVPVPTYVDIGPLRYTIICSKPQMQKARKEHPDANFVGLHEHAALLIVLDPDMPPSFRREVLLHEINHAIWYLAGFADGKYLQEDLVARQTPWQLQVLRQNPHVMEFLLADD